MVKGLQRMLGALACFGWLGLGTSTEAAALRTDIPENYLEPQVTMTQDGPTLLFSDSPELVHKTGVLYTDVVQGAARVFVHHVNETKRPLKLAVLVQPVGPLHGKKLTLTLQRYGFAEPNVDYYEAAPLSQKRYFQAQEPKTEALRLFESRELLTRSAEAKAGWVVKPDQLVTGMCDFTADAPVRVTVMMCETSSDIREFVRHAPVLPMDEHPLRGTFAHADLHFMLPPMDLSRGQVYGLLQASGSQNQYLRGTDATTGQAVENYGNYGVVYSVDYQVAPPVDYQLSVNAWGGIYAGTGRLDLPHKKQVERRLQAWPEGGAFDDSGETRFVFGKLAKKYDRGTLVWSPAGAGNLPLRFFWEARDKHAEKAGNPHT